MRVRLNVSCPQWEHDQCGCVVSAENAQSQRADSSSDTMNATPATRDDGLRDSDGIKPNLRSWNGIASAIEPPTLLNASENRGPDETT